MPSPATDIRDAIVLTVATIAAGFVVPVIPVAGIPMAALALGRSTYRFGMRPAFALALVAGVLPPLVAGPMFGLSPYDSVFVVVTMVVCGPGVAWALRRYPALDVLAVASLIIAGAFLLSPLGGQTFEASMAVARRFSEALVDSGGVADAGALKETAGALLRRMAATYPATTVYNMGMGVLLAVPLVSRSARSLGVEASRYPSLETVDVSFHLVWPVIVGFAFLAAAQFQHAGEGTLWAIGTNLLMLVRPALFLQGVAVFAALYRRLNMSGFMKGIGYMLLLAMEAIIPSASVLGLLDLFVNIRKVPRGDTTVPAPQL